MDDATLEDPSIANFVDEVDKEIITEASTDAWHQPRPGDMVTAEVGERSDDRLPEIHTWRVGAGTAISVGGVDLDRCVRTMRRGEVAKVRAKGEVAAVPEQVSLLALERTEDILGDGRLVRLTLQDGTGWQTPQAGTELRVRFAWRLAPTSGETVDADAAPGVTCILLKGPVDTWAASAKSREMGDLHRTLLRRYGGTITMRTSDDKDDKGPALRVVRGSDELFSGADPICARAALESPAMVTAHREAREVVMSMEEGRCVCSADDWIPGVAGLRVLTDLREGQRCLVRIFPDLAFGGQGLPELGVPPNATLEYDVEVLKIMKLEDISLDNGGGVVKKTIREGEGYDRPTEGAKVTLRLEVREHSSGAVLLEEQEVTFEAGSGRFCSAIDETVLVMKKGEACEVHCTDSAAFADAELGLKPSANPIVFSLELVDFEKIDLYTLQEAERVAHCSRRKEFGSKFFQGGESRRALKRYQHVTSALAYLDHWKDASAKADATALRRLCHLNAAACWLKLEVWREAEVASGNVLAEEPDNVKALFRRGRALQELGEYREAERYVRKALGLEKENKEAARLLVKLRQLVKSEADQQKEMFSRMARGIGSNGEDADEGGSVPAGEGGSGAAKGSNNSQAGGTGADKALLKGESDGGLGNVTWTAAVVLTMAATALFFAVARRRWPSSLPAGLR